MSFCDKEEYIYIYKGKIYNIYTALIWDNLGRILISLDLRKLRRSI